MADICQRVNRGGNILNWKLFEILLDPQKYRRFMIYILTTVWLHSDYIWQHYDYILTTIWLHSGYILAIFWLWLYSGYILVTLWLYSGYILATFWLNSDYILNTFELHSDYIKTFFLLFSAKLITADGAYHGPVGSIWPFFLLDCR